MQIRTTPSPSSPTSATRVTPGETFDVPRDTVTLGEGPDLTISRLRASFPRPDGAVGFRFEVANLGNQAAGAFEVQFAPDFAPPVTARLEGLEAGRAQAFRVEGYRVPGGRFTYHAVAVADPANQVAETNERNNQARVTVHAPPEPPPTPPLPPPPVPPVPPRP